MAGGMRALSDQNTCRIGHRIDDHGNIYRPGNCPSCKACWINAATGRCMYGGPVQYVASMVVPGGDENSACRKFRQTGTETGGKRSLAGECPER
jgi:hypothetical protein